MHKIRKELLELINQCTKSQQYVFKRMYSHKNLNLPLEDVIKKMDMMSIILATRQTKSTILKNEDKIELKLHKLKNNILNNENKKRICE